MGRAVRGGEKGVGRSAGAEPGVPPEVDLAVSRLERGTQKGDEGKGGDETGAMRLAKRWEGGRLENSGMGWVCFRQE